TGHRRYWVPPRCCALAMIDAAKRLRYAYAILLQQRDEWAKPLMLWSGGEDSNLRPPAPDAATLASWRGEQSRAPFRSRDAPRLFRRRCPSDREPGRQAPSVEARQIFPGSVEAPASSLPMTSIRTEVVCVPRVTRDGRPPRLRRNAPGVRGICLFRLPDQRSDGGSGGADRSVNRMICRLDSTRGPGRLKYHVR